MSYLLFKCLVQSGNKTVRGAGPDRSMAGTLSFREKRNSTMDFSAQICLKNPSADVFQGPAIDLSGPAPRTVLFPNHPNIFKS